MIARRLAVRRRGGCAAAQRASARATTPCAPAISTRPWRTTARRAGRSRQPELQDRARARDGQRRRARISSGRRSSRSRISSRPRAANTGWPASTIRATDWPPPRSPSSIRRSATRIEAARPRPPIEQLREQARAAARRADAQPGVARAAQPALHQRQPPRHPDVHRQRDRHQHHLRPRRARIGARRPSSSTASRSSRRCNQIMTMNQLSYKVLSERSIFVFPDNAPKHAQYDEQVIHTFYLSHADATELSQLLSSIMRAARHRRQPAIAGQQDRQHDHRPRHRAGGADHRADHRAERQAARRDRRSTSRSSKSIATRAKSYGLNLSEYAVGGVFSPEVVAERRPSRHDDRDAGGTTPATTNDGGRSTSPSAIVLAAAVQPEHDFARRQHRRLLPGRADRDRPVPRDRHARPSSSPSRSCAARKARS